MAVPLVPPLASRTDLSAIAEKFRKARARRQDSIPPEIQESINRFAMDLTNSHGSVLAENPRMKYQLARLLAGKLPPTARRSGRPGRQDVSEAIRLRAKLRRTEPNPRRMWAKICIAVIPGYELLPEWDRKEVRRRLRERVRWRIAARARRRQRVKTLTTLKTLNPNSDSGF
jgi:hypothetical protein